MSDLQHSESSRSESQKKRTKKTSDQPKDWTIKGLPADTVEITREAAKQNGMKINAWVSRALYEAATEVSHERDFPASHGGVEVAQYHLSDEISRLRRQNEELIQTVTNMTNILAKMYAEKF